MGFKNLGCRCFFTKPKKPESLNFTFVRFLRKETNNAMRYHYSGDHSECSDNVILATHCFFASFRNEGNLRRLESKIQSNFSTFSLPVKIRGGMSEIFERIVRARFIGPTSNVLFTGTLGILED